MSVSSEQLISLTTDISYLQMPTNLGFIRFENDDGEKCIYIVDSGNDETNGARILDFIRENFPDHTLKVILNTLQKFFGDPPPRITQPFRVPARMMEQTSLTSRLGSIISELPFSIA